SGCGSIDCPISGAAHGGDVAWMVGLLAKLVAQPADVDVDGPLQGIALYRPIESVEQDLTGQDPAFSLHQCREQAELSCRQGNNSVVTSQLEPVEIDREVAVLNRAPILRPSRRALSPA